MVLGLRTGSTAKHAVDRNGELLHQGKLKDIVGIPTSKKMHEQAFSLGIPLSDLDSHPVVDLAIDGADEVDPYLNLVKGRVKNLTFHLHPQTRLWLCGSNPLALSSPPVYHHLQLSPPPPVVTAVDVHHLSPHPLTLNLSISSSLPSLLLWCLSSPFAAVRCRSLPGSPPLRYRVRHLSGRHFYRDRCPALVLFCILHFN
ncbi:hypothetical protein HN873_033499 [Arachis hypogaea]